MKTKVHPKRSGIWEASLVMPPGMPVPTIYIVEQKSMYIRDISHRKFCHIPADLCR